MKIKTKTGKLKYLSQVRQNRARKLERKNQGIDWADWRPKHTKGVFANLSINNYTHNRKERVL